MNSKIDQLCDLQFTRFISDQDVIRLFIANSSIYNRNCPRYIVKESYSTSTIIGVCLDKKLLHPKFTKLIITDIDCLSYSQIKYILSLNMVKTLVFRNFSWDENVKVTLSNITTLYFNAMLENVTTSITKIIFSRWRYSDSVLELFNKVLLHHNCAKINTIKCIDGELPNISILNTGLQNHPYLQCLYFNNTFLKNDQSYIQDINTTFSDILDSKLCQLTSLSIFRNERCQYFVNIQSNIFKSLQNNNNNNITYLDINESYLTNYSITLLTKYISSTKILQKLNLDYIKYNDRDINDQLFMQAFQQNSSLTSINLTEIMNINIILSLLNNINLKELNIPFNDLKDNDIKLICKKSLSNITKLYLDYNPIGADGFKAICDLLLTNKTIQILSLARCSHILLIPLRMVIQSNNTLQVLCLKSCNIDDFKFSKLHIDFSRNKNIKKLDLSYNEITNEKYIIDMLSTETNNIEILNICSNRFTTYNFLNQLKTPTRIIY